MAIPALLHFGCEHLAPSPCVLVSLALGTSETSQLQTTHLLHHMGILQVLARSQQTPVRGMLLKVRHLEDAEDAPSWTKGQPSSHPAQLCLRLGAWPRYPCCPHCWPAKGSSSSCPYTQKPALDFFSPTVKHAEPGPGDKAASVYPG